MQFPAEKRRTSAMTIQAPDDLLERIKTDAKGLGQSRNERAVYLMEYAYQAGDLNTFIDKMAGQFAEMSARAQLDHDVIASYDQVDRLKDQITYLDDNVRNLIDVVKRLSVTILQEKESVAKA